MHCPCVGSVAEEVAVWLVYYSSRHNAQKRLTAAAVGSVSGCSVFSGSGAVLVLGADHRT